MHFGACRDARRWCGRQGAHGKYVPFREGGLKMSIRFFSNLALAVAGAFIVVASQAFTPV